jgi:hypothetical protein
MGVGQLHAPATLPLGMTRYPLYRKLGEPQDRSGQVRKISLPPEFDPRTVQPDASHYIDWAIPAPVKQGLGPELRDLLYAAGGMYKIRR